MPSLIIRLARVAILAIALLLPAAAPAFAGAAETALLQQYEGAWKGAGQMTGVQKGKIACKLTFKSAGDGALSYSGRCTFGMGTTSFKGTMSYNVAKKRFESTSTATGITATAVGKKQGSGLVFSMSDVVTTHGTASSTMALAGNAINISFKLVDKRGKVTTSTVVFKKS
jgi:hypothetical protein